MVRIEDAALLRGQRRFVDDLDIPGALHAAFLRSAVAHARLNGIDTNEARALAGVQAVRPTPLNPLGVKGAAESGTIAAPAVVASAVEDALRPFGVCIRDLPITPERLRALSRAARP
jgi:carbon-monoxide dehydrogenase large subunit